MSTSRGKSLRPYASLSRRGQIGRLRRLGQVALANYGLNGATMTPLRHENNTTFRVDAGGGPYILRINRIGVHTTATIDSEMAWLTALRRDTHVGVPEPVATPEGSMVVLASDPGVPEPRLCVLLRWQAGRFVDARLTPWHLRQVAVTQAALQHHGFGWTPPEGFVRPRVDTLTDAAKRVGVFGSADEALAVEQPTRQDADRSLRLIAAVHSAADAAVFARALDVVWSTTRELAAQPGSFGLIHGDLHQENYLFHDDAARAIDFDDCGWGFYLYDLAVPLSELDGRPGFDDLRAALLDEYARHRPLPVRHAAHLEAFAILRGMQILIWILENREHAAFRDDWLPWSRKVLGGIAAALDG
jgi:Ser/Thr protein kinase RdoA (MazF antagonist)